ncbi:hypothetical protein [Mycoplasma suis]|uniref:hypothetical protein n=1 Tax=Mycoplasma suis TaxID=57372 RepID=UPI0013050EE8|nr:hypothetical protein [Mycoplasma suis]
MCDSELWSFGWNFSENPCWGLSATFVNWFCVCELNPNSDPRPEPMPPPHHL